MDDLFPPNGKLEKVFEDKEKGFISDEIDKNTFIKLMNAMSINQKYCDSIVLYTSLQDSIDELIDYLNNISFDGKYSDYAKANRLTLNVLSSFYSLIEFCNKNIENFKDDYAHELYDKYFSYRLFYYLRVYMTHKSLGVTSFQMTINADAMIVTANVDIGKMINSDAIKKTFCEELKQLNVSSVPLNDYISEFKEAINELMFTIFKNESGKIVENYIFIKKNIPNSNIKISECYIKDEKGKAHSLTKSITNLCEIYSKGLIYKNKIEINPDVSKECFDLFVVISFLYFNKENVVVKPD